MATVPSEERIDSESVQSVLHFLKSSVPKSDLPNVEDELKKDFVLAKRRSKRLKRKPRKKKSKVLTRKEKKALGFYEALRDSVKYNDILPMHMLWTEYIYQVLELNKPMPDQTSKSWENFSQTLYKADFHGSMLHIVRSKCPSYVGKKGICIMDTKNTFKIVSKDNKVTTIPKKECVFEILIKNIKITIFGKQLCVRPAERSTKKVKAYNHPDL